MDLKTTASIEGIEERHPITNESRITVEEQDDIDAGPFDTPTRPPPRSGKKSAGSANGKKMTPSGGKWKRRQNRNDGIEGEWSVIPRNVRQVGA